MRHRRSSSGTRFSARDLEEGVGAVELALQGPAGEELVADHRVVAQADDGLVDAGDLRFADHAL